MVKSRHMKGLLAAIDGRPQGPAVRGRLEPSVLSTIDDSRGVEWLPLQWNLDLTRAIAAELGPEGTHAFFRDQLLDSFRGPLLGLLVDSAVRVFGIDPASWARWVPKGWALVFRDCGVWTVEADRAGRRVVLRCADLPEACAGDEVWLRSVASSLSAMLDFARAKGGVALTGFDPVARAATFVMKWE